MAETPKPERLVQKTFLSTIRNSVGSKIFRNFFLKENGRTFDAMNAGDLSCAFYVSGILTMFGLIKSLHGTVVGTEKDLIDSGWQKTNAVTPGCVLIWEAEAGASDPHQHIGFYIGRNLAVSNSSAQRKIAKHHWTYNDTRKVEAMYQHKLLNQS